jgi:hypothetical protein
MVDEYELEAEKSEFYFFGSFVVRDADAKAGLIALREDGPESRLRQLLHRRMVRVADDIADEDFERTRIADLRFEFIG